MRDDPPRPPPLRRAAHGEGRAVRRDRTDHKIDNPPEIFWNLKMTPRDFLEENSTMKSAEKSRPHPESPTKRGPGQPRGPATELLTLRVPIGIRETVNGLKMRMGYKSQAQVVLAALAALQEKERREQVGRKTRKRREKEIAVGV